MEFSLENFGRERDDLEVVLLAELAGDRAENPGAARLALVIDHDAGVVVKTNVASVRAARLAPLANHDRLHHVALLHRGAWQRGLHRADDLVADGGITPAGRA